VFILYPAIDLKGGRCVRLTQGRADAATIYRDNPAEVAGEFTSAGAEWIHVVDLDGAFTGAPRNAEAVAAIAKVAPRMQLGGGMRTREAVTAALAAGVARVVIGTKAWEDETFLRDVVAAHGDRIAVGIDARDGFVTIKGWVEKTATRAVDLARKAEAVGVRTIIYTDIATDGMLTGPNYAALGELLAAVGCRVIASGGVSNLSDITRLAAMAKQYPHLDGAIVGKAIYEGRVNVAEALAALR
jgi:phosphoribosylformimino-5-aminoimidazole carboxamide ribotide isomerase